MENTGKENVIPGIDQKVIPEEKNVENVEKVDEILALEYKSIETTAKIIKPAPEIVKPQNNKTDTGAVLQAARKTLTFENKDEKTIEIINNVPSGYVIQATNEILTSDYKSVETNKAFMKNVPDINEPQNNNVNIIHTPSGTAAMEVENTFVDELEKKLIENSNMHVYLGELNSGQLIVDFKPQNNVSNIKVQVNKSAIGEIQFVLFKNLATYIRPCESCDSVCEQSTGVESLILKVIRSECKLKGTPMDGRRKVCNEAERVSMTKKRIAARKTAKMAREDIRNFIEDILLNEIPKARKIHHCRLTDKERKSVELYKKEIEIFYESNRGKINLNIQGANGATACVEANLTRTLSGNIAMDIKDMNCVGVIADRSKECPVMLKKSPSGAFVLFVGCQGPEQEPNTVLRRTASGQMLIVITEPVLRSFSLPAPPLQELVQEKLYKVRIKGASSRVTALPAFVKMTPSSNYILVLDKEFEKQFNDHLLNSMNEHSQCYIELQNTASDAIVINFNNECNENTCYSRNNALLVKTPFGHLRILVNGEEYSSLTQNLLKVDSNKSAKAFEELLQHMHTLSSPGCSKSKNKPEAPLKKQNSDSQLLESDRNSHLTNFDRPIKIQKTASGQYAVVLDKNSKMAFLTDLKNYLSVNTKGIVPVRRMGSGDIIIVLDTKGQSTDLYGSLTITPSGNVYVTMDENVLKALSSTPSGMTQLGSHHIIKKVKQPEDKGVDTSCTVNLDDCLCDPSCICKDLLECVDKRKKPQETKCGHSYKIKNSLRRNLPCNPTKCYAPCCMKNRFTKATDAENVPCECVNPSFSEERNTQQCYYMYNSVRPMNKNLSNELIVVSCPCSKTNNDTSSTDTLDDTVKEFTSDTSHESVDSSTYDWNYLPPQLPSFLGNFRPVMIS